MNEDKRTPGRLPDEARLVHAAGVRLVERDGVSVLVAGDAGDAEPQSLSPMALALWELCDGETTVGEMVRACLALFDAPPERVRTDIGTALSTLLDARMLQKEG